MIFNSLQFWLFFSVVLIIYYLVKSKYKWMILLLCSYLFYLSWDIKHLALLIICTGITYLAGKFIASTEIVYLKKFSLIVCLILNIGILGVFKYYNFFAESLQVLLEKLNISIQATNLNILLPIGISFYIFKGLCYTIDVYRRKIKEERHFGKYALFVAFFPSLLAGPIIRPGDFLPQIDKIDKFDQEKAIKGFQLVCIGLFKKIVVADRLATLVNAVYDNIYSYGGQAYLIATIFFSFQIYFDFSAYSEIAIGCANILGYDLHKNFDKPYLAKSNAEFWRRWHISLSTWFRDYLYIPMGGSRKGIMRGGINILVVFLVSGLWHGAAWTFIIWGGLHGGIQIIEKMFVTLKQKAGLVMRSNIFSKVCRMAFNFLLVSFTWIFFRANTLSDAGYIISNLFSFGEGFDVLEMGMMKQDFLLAVILVAILMGWEVIQEHFNIDLNNYFNKFTFPAKCSIYILILMFIVLFGVYGNLNESSFVYLQF